MPFQQTTPALNNGRPRLFYGYIIVGAAVCIQIIGWGLFNSYGIFFNRMLADFHWPRETISGAFSISQLFIGIGAIFLGSLNDRIGPRLLMTIGGILAGLGYILMSQVESVWLLYLAGGFIVGIGLSGTDVVLLSTTARWFTKRRGIMSGVVKMGTGIGIMAVPLICARFISLVDWRNTLIIMGTALFIVYVAGAQMLRRDPALMNLLPDGEIEDRNNNAPETDAGITLKQAWVTRRFWLLCSAYFAILFVTNTMIIHIAPFTVDLKLGESFAAVMVSAIGGASIIGRLTMGLTSDRIGSRRALLVTFIVFLVALAWVQTVKSSWQLIAFTIAYGFAQGGFYAVISPVVAEFFGTRAHGAILGIVIFIASVGGAVGPLLTGRIFDKLGSYHLAFFIMLVLAAAGMLMIFLSRPPRQQP